LKKIIFILPLYNDWKSANKILKKINEIFSKQKAILKIIIVNDCSTEEIGTKIKKLSNIKTIKVLNLNKNLGSQKAIYIGLKKIEHETNSVVVIMDADGEDDPSKLKKLINKATQNTNRIVFAKRVKRTENFILKFLNNIRLVLTFLLTGKYLNIGNFCAFSGNNLKKLLSNNNLIIAFSSGAVKNIKNNYYFGIEKKKRYFGSSKVNFYFLIIHSLNIITVFYKEVFFRTSIIFLIILIVYETNYSLIFLLFYFLINSYFAFNYFLNIKKDLNLNVIKTIKKIN